MSSAENPNEPPAGLVGPLTTPEAAVVIGYSPRTLEDMRQRGDGPPYIRLSAGRVRYRRADVDAWLAARVVTPGKAA